MYVCSGENAMNMVKLGVPIQHSTIYPKFNQLKSSDKIRSSQLEISGLTFI